MLVLLNRFYSLENYSSAWIFFCWKNIEAFISIIFMSYVTYVCMFMILVMMNEINDAHVVIYAYFVDNIIMMSNVNCDKLQLRVRLWHNFDYFCVFLSWLSVVLWSIVLFLFKKSFRIVLKSFKIQKCN